MPVSDFSTWMHTFQELIQEEEPGNRWTLQLNKSIVPDEVALGWRQYQQTVPGRFQCSICNRGWSSAQVKILCHMYKELSQGRVLMRIFAQRCQKCFGSRFEDPEFSTETINRILKNLVNYILRRYYGHGFRNIPTTPNACLDEKLFVDGPHDACNCEACALGRSGGCAFKPKAKLPKSPSPSPKSHSSFPPKSCYSSPQPGNMSSERLFQERTEPRDSSISLLGILAIAAVTILGLIIR
ncbi:receptor-transporting protein 4 [Acomys russatus]|uniref:receptor-transporting protein 4 n=1 Tax=Acomys russatus TaxID=60746 RepID=UPI0021E2B731|nr:receptor-transporting protein 4 [Acomys russatus]